MAFTVAATQTLALPSGEKVFWREAGSVDSPTILLLHGFPSSSHQFRNLIPLLAPKYRVIAPDFPGYGFTEIGPDYKCTFDNLAATVDSFLQALPNPPAKYSIYVFDYGAPVGIRLALKYPEKIQAIITQNGNAFDEGLGKFWDPIRTLWGEDNKANRDALRFLFEMGATNWQYTNGEAAPGLVPPESYTLDQALMDRPGNKELQLDLFSDYKSNLKLYPAFQKWMKESAVPILVAWGKNDEIFIYAGAEPFKTLPNAEIHPIDGGHFVLESHLKEMSDLILAFLAKNGI
ncbi:alpha/beta-hydrolase [Amniculicola lignicola CBS 123094]|uniref:Alpha/beta-hydrolase n=1 Tax=Amniculicola lignicola CBS 123094 TaxID=1392246 RepID=A0A6A5W9H0_9PLEO|nr:alpha/beta-hydrolase [Amniculicola lignicola CBS 123094]